MKAIVLVAVLVGCKVQSQTGPDAADPDQDGASVPTGGEYWPCYFWGDVSQTVSKCSPKCANKTLLGRYVFGEHNTCDIGEGQQCPTQFMTGSSYESGTGCCVYSTTPTERVQFVACQSE